MNKPTGTFALQGGEDVRPIPEGNVLSEDGIEVSLQSEWQVQYDPAKNETFVWRVRF